MKLQWRRNTLILLTSAVLVFFASGCKSVVKGLMTLHPKYQSVFRVPPMDRTVTGTGWLDTVGESTNRITVLYVAVSNHYSVGYFHGKLLGPEVKSTIENVLTGAEKLIPKEVKKILSAKERRSLVTETLGKAWGQMSPYVPRQDLEEMEGLADGLRAAGVKGVDLDTIHGVHAAPDLGETSCSWLVACGNATRDTHAYQLRILDYGAEFRLQERPLITVCYPTATHEHTFINVGWVGFVGLVSGMNDRGVCISEKGNGAPLGERLDGMPMIFLLKQALRYSDTANEASAIIHSARRNNSYAYGIGDPDGNAVGLIASADDFKAYRINGQKEIRNGKKVLPQYDDVIYTGRYAEKQGQIIRRMHGTLDVPSIKEMAREIAMKSNLQSVIFDLTTLDLVVANRYGTNRAVNCVYVPFPVEKWKR